jgi:hypothetical protein
VSLGIYVEDLGDEIRSRCYLGSVSKRENLLRYMPTYLGVILSVRTDHVCVTARDVDRSIEFYSKGLGLKLLRVSVPSPSPQTVYKKAYMYSDSFLLELITAEDSDPAEDS